MFVCEFAHSLCHKHPEQLSLLCIRKLNFLEHLHTSLPLLAIGGSLHSGASMYSTARVPDSAVGLLLAAHPIRGPPLGPLKVDWLVH